MSHPSSKESYSDSILSEYYNDSRTTLGSSNIPQIHISKANHDPNTPSTPIQEISRQTLSPISRDSPQSSSQSVYSSGNVSTDEEIRQLNEDTIHKQQSKLKKFFSKRKSSKEMFNSSNNYNNQINIKISDFLLNEYYTTNNMNYQEILEYYIFQNLIENVFDPAKFQLSDYGSLLFNYLFQSELENGNEIFQLSANFQPEPITNELVYLVLKNVIKELDTFQEILSQYKDKQKNLNFLKSTHNNNFQKLNFLANKKKFLIPLALSIYGNWLLSFNSNEFEYNENVRNENYNNEEIINFFRKSSRISIILRKLNDLKYFDIFLQQKDKNGNKYFDNQEILMLKKFLGKDNDLSLGISLFSIGEYYHFKTHTNIAINIWEINGHITKELESCSMAIWGLTDGFGYGNKKHIHNKKRKFLVKQRIAKLYRVLIKNGGKEDYGSSWVWKPKYD